MKIGKIISALILTLSLYIIFFTLPASAKADFEGDKALSECVAAVSDNIKVDSRLRELFFGNEKHSATSLVPGGNVFGIKIKQSHVTVTESGSIPALSPGDKILSVNGKEVSTVSEVKEAVNKCAGGSVTIRAEHNGAEIAIEVKPSLVDGEYRLGLSLRDSASGIGTITYYDPESSCFGGLGHGVCDSESGEIIEMKKGEVTGVILGGLHKGECGKPGELSGVLKSDTIGSLEKNNGCGVFGVLTAPGSLKSKEAIPIGTRNEIHEGEATIISSLRNGKSGEYKIEIYDIDKSSDGSKSFRIRATDPALIAISGGIVRGMSGSPIIQDGKLVGAVTHVMVANPTEGYGIFIENMLNAAQDQAIPKAA